MTDKNKKIKKETKQISAIIPNELVDYLDNLEQCDVTISNQTQAIIRVIAEHKKFVTIENLDKQVYNKLYGKIDEKSLIRQEFIDHMVSLGYSIEAIKETWETVFKDQQLYKDYITLEAMVKSILQK